MDNIGTDIILNAPIKVQQQQQQIASSEVVSMFVSFKLS